jgi:hypothetical protein
MQIEAVLFLNGVPHAVHWSGGTLTSTSTVLLDALLLMQEAYTGSPIGMPGYPPNYSAALGDPSGFMALCYMLSERFPFLAVYEAAV